MTGTEHQKFLLASDAGYGFVAKFGDLVAKNKAGKAVLSLPKGAQVMPPVIVPSVRIYWLLRRRPRDGY